MTRHNHLCKGVLRAISSVHVHVRPPSTREFCIGSGVLRRIWADRELCVGKVALGKERRASARVRALWTERSRVL